MSGARPRPPRPPAFLASPSELPPARPLQALLPRAHLCKHPPASRENGPFVPSLALVPQPRRQLRPQPGCHGPGLAIVPAGPRPPPPGSGQTTPVRSSGIPAAVRAGGAGWARVRAVSGRASGTARGGFGARLPSLRMASLRAARAVSPARTPRLPAWGGRPRACLRAVLLSGTWHGEACCLGRVPHG